MSASSSSVGLDPGTWHTLHIIIFERFTYRPHHRSQFLGGHCAVSVLKERKENKRMFNIIPSLVEHHEHLLVVLYLVLPQLDRVLVRR